MLFHKRRGSVVSPSRPPGEGAPKRVRTTHDPTSSLVVGKSARIKKFLLNAGLSLFAIFATLMTVYQEQLLYNETLAEALNWEYQREIDDFFFNAVGTSDGKKIALVLVAHDREEYLRECVKSLIGARRLDEVNIIVSMDSPAYYDKVKSVINEFNLTPRRTLFLKNSMFLGSWIFHSSDDAITHHYGKIFASVFERMKFDFIISLETDLIVSPDFLEFMIKGANWLSDDDTFCISGWNDNGFPDYELREDRLFRTDFFPGLGWMMHRDVWLEKFSPSWPSRFGTNVYDMWIRYRSPLAYKECIAPEVSRTHHISKYGAHVNGNRYKVYDEMLLAGGSVEIPDSEFSIVGDVDKFEERIKNEVLSSPSLTRLDYQTFLAEPGIPTNADILIVVPGGPLDSASTELNLVLAKLLLFTRTFRSGHKGLITVKMKQYNSRITLVRQEFAPSWGLLAPRTEG